MSQPPFSCRCGARWGGFNTAHCADCHETFSTVGNFDRHRTLKGQERECRPPAEAGLVLSDRSKKEGGYSSPVWVQPLKGEGREAVA